MDSTNTASWTQQQQVEKRERAIVLKIQISFQPNSNLNPNFNHNLNPYLNLKMISTFQPIYKDDYKDIRVKQYKQNKH